MLTTPAAPRRLLRYDTAEQQVVCSELQEPVGMAWDESSKSLYLLEISGRLQRLKVEY